MKRLLIVAGFIIMVCFAMVSCSDHVCPAYADHPTEQPGQSNT